MPAFDQTGPQGQGPMTGRGFGPCGYGGGFFGGRRGWGFCRWFGWRRGIGPIKSLRQFFGWNDPQTKEEKIEQIKNYKKALQQELEDIDKQLITLQK